jgi:hypothetical protein
MTVGTQDLKALTADQVVDARGTSCPGAMSLCTWRRPSPIGWPR